MVYTIMLANLQEIIRRTQETLLSKRTTYRLLFLCIVLGYLLLIVPTISYQGISWDEEIDLRIARAYLTSSGIFFGLSLDHTQTRLPMFLVALVYRLIGSSDLLIARGMSVLAGGLTLFGVYIYGQSHFSHGVGLLAAALLAVSPFFLSFARVAFTESDIYLACTLTWLLVTVSRLQVKPTVGRAAIAGIIFGLSIASKATVLVIVPAIWIALTVSQVAAGREKSFTSIPAGKSVTTSALLFWGGWAVLVLFAGVYSGIIWSIYTYPTIIRLLHYGLVFLGWTFLLMWVFRFRNHTAGHIPLAFLFTGIGLLSFLVFPPDHLTNSGILQQLFGRAENEMTFSTSFVTEVAALHLLAIIFKSTPLLGLGLFIGSLVSMFKWRQLGLLPLLILVSYFAGLLLLPLGQTFYTMPLLPILSLLAAHQFMQLWLHRRRIAYVLALLSTGLWVVEMIQSYPDYHLNGYQWLGERVLFGRSSIGYRSVVFTPSDGVQQAIEWLNAHAEPGQVAQLYIGPWHIVRYTAPDPAYKLTNGFEDSLLSKPDYVVVHINEIITEGNERDDTPQGGVIHFPFDREMLTQEYEKVFRVPRAFDLEVVSVWQRK